MSYKTRNNNFNLVKSVFNSWSITTWLIIVNIFIFISISIMQIFIGQKIYDYVALFPVHLLTGKYVWTLFTHMFMHADIFHLMFNMFSLWFIGRFLEKIIGRKRFLWAYILSGLFAGLVFVFFAGFFGVSEIGIRIFGNPNIPGVGASGAIFGLLGILIMLVPRMRVYLILGPFIAIILQAILSSSISNESLIGLLSVLVNIYLIFSIYVIFSFSSRFRKIALPIEMYIWVLPFIAIIPLIIIGFKFDLPIANTAHLGGLIAGLIYGFYLKTRYKNKVMLLQRYFR